VATLRLTLALLEEPPASSTLAISSTLLEASSTLDAEVVREKLAVAERRLRRLGGQVAVRTGLANSYPWSPFPPRRARP